MKNQSKNAKSQSEHAKIPSENPKTQFENAKTQKTAQVLAQVFLDRRSKKNPCDVSEFIEFSLDKVKESSARPTPDGIFRLDKQADYNNAGSGGGMVRGYCDAHHLIVSLDAGPGLAFTSARLLIPVVDNLPANWPGQAQL